jgi:thiamine-phosphate pyrophosphorylase
VELLHTRACAPISGLYALTPDISDTEELTARVDAAIAGGASAVQYRNKSAPLALKLEQARSLRRICRDHATLFIVNDDVDLALAVDADGVHLGKDDASVAAARSRLGRSAVVGVSCYDDLERAAAAVGAGADYIAFGSFFSSAVKPEAARANASLLTAAKSRWTLPVVAIGGITAANAVSLIDAGADAVAVISAVFEARDVKSAAKAIARLFVDEALHRRG